MHTLSTDLLSVIERLNRLHHDFRNDVNRALLNHGLTLSKVRVLHAVGESPGCNATHIMTTLNYSCRNVTESLESLELSGLISRKRIPGNRKVKIITLTEHGQDRLQMSMQIRDNILTQRLSCLDDHELILFKGIINKIYAEHGQK